MAERKLPPPILQATSTCNAINFSIDPMQSNGRNGASDTARYAKVKVFLCPPDGNAGKTFINSYGASMGKTNRSSNSVDNTKCNAGTGGSSGMFYYAISYGIRDCNDGSSNTVAFSEGLVGDANATQPQPQDGGDHSELPDSPSTSPPRSVDDAFVSSHPSGRASRSTRAGRREASRWNDSADQPSSSRCCFFPGSGRIPLRRRGELLGRRWWLDQPRVPFCSTTGPAGKTVK
jgi:hypothetical protein